MAARKTTTKAPATRKPAADKAAGKHIPDAPTDAGAVNAEATANAPTSEAAKDHTDFKEPGSTLNPSDPNAPNYRFAPDAAVDDINSDQGVDQGTGVQPNSPMLHAPGGGKSDKDDPGLHWTDEEGPRGRVITVTKGALDGPTTSHEEVLPLGANDAQVSAAKERLNRRFIAA